MALPATDLKQVIFRLPDSLHAGTAIIQVQANGQFSNPGIIRIKVV